MLVEVALGGIAFAQAWKGYELNERAMKTLQEAHSTHADAVYLAQSHKKAADQKLRKLVDRKKAILTTRMTQFLSVYQEIRKIDFQPGEGIAELYSNALSVQQVNEIKVMANTALKPLSNREIALSLLFPANLYLKDAKRNVQLANNQMQIADTMYEQAETLVIAMDAIGERADQISGLLAKFSVLFAGSIQETSEIIRRNGTDRMRYTREDREVLLTCVNLASAVKTVLDVPILDQKGNLTAASAKVIEDSKRRMKEIEQVMKG